MRIGLLEDNPAIVDWLTTALEMAGHAVSHHTDGPSLLACLFDAEGSVSEPLPYDLVLVDFYLPGDMSGLQVIDAIRAIIPKERLPLIVISGASLRELERIGASHPDLPIVQKPFKVSDLLALIETSGIIGCN